jgi:hypothetical protein
MLCTFFLRTDFTTKPSGHFIQPLPSKVPDPRLGNLNNLAAAQSGKPTIKLPILSFSAFLFHFASSSLL